MTRLSGMGRAAAVAMVVAGALLLTLALHGVSRVDTRLEVAAAEQAVPERADCPFRSRDRERV